jgi:Flp pilus assembly protein TadG
MRLPSVSPRRLLGNDRGTSTIEFLVVLPFLLLIMLASVEFSRAFLTLNLATTAAREGARRGAVSEPGDVKPQGEARALEVLNAGGIACCATVNCLGPCALGTESRVQADIAVNFRTIVPLFLPMLTEITLNQTASMRYEGSVP